MVRASSALAVTQPAVSYLIGSLESAVGFALFRREKGKLIPTPEAHQLIDEVDRLYESVDEVEAVARLIANHQRAVLRILLTPALSTGACVQAIGRYAARHPGMRLDIDTAHRATILRRLLSGHADLAVLSLPVETDRIVATSVFTSDLVCVLPAHHEPPRPDTITPDDLAGVPLIGLKPSGVIRPLVLGGGRQAELRHRSARCLDRHRARAQRRGRRHRRPHQRPAFWRGSAARADARAGRADRDRHRVASLASRPPHGRRPGGFPAYADAAQTVRRVFINMS